MIELLDAVTTTVMVTFIATTIMLVEFSRRADITRIRDLWAELRPFYPPAALFQLGLEVFHVEVLDQPTAWQLMMSVLGVLVWWLLKDVDDDDRWNRRRRKVTDKIRTLASGRLTVEPA